MRNRGLRLPFESWNDYDITKGSIFDSNSSSKTMRGGLLHDFNSKISKISRTNTFFELESSYSIHENHLQCR